jgi:polycystin 1L2
VGYGIRELNANEFNSYCSNNTTTTSVPKVPLITELVNFTSDFLIRTYTSGCYYFDRTSGKWFSDGMYLYGDTNIQETHCSSTHLTSFAGGLLIMPNHINVHYVFSNASPSKNYTIYITLLIFVFLYIIFALWALFMDRVDLRRLNFVPLKDNHANDNYFYELIVFTGNYKYAGTQSNVI